MSKKKFTTPSGVPAGLRSGSNLRLVAPAPNLEPASQAQAAWTVMDAAAVQALSVPGLGDDVISALNRMRRVYRRAAGLPAAVDVTSEHKLAAPQGPVTGDYVVSLVARTIAPLIASVPLNDPHRASLLALAYCGGAA